MGRQSSFPMLKRPIGIFVFQKRLKVAAIKRALRRSFERVDSMRRMGEGVEEWQRSTSARVSSQFFCNFLPIRLFGDGTPPPRPAGAVTVARDSLPWLLNATENSARDENSQSLVLGSFVCMPVPSKLPVTQDSVLKHLVVISRIHTSILQLLSEYDSSHKSRYRISSHRLKCRGTHDKIRLFILFHIDVHVASQFARRPARAARRRRRRRRRSCRRRRQD